MATLTSLKLSSAVKTTVFSTTQLRRNKMISAIAEQIAIAKALQAGSAAAITKLRSVKDPETGERKLVESTKRVKQWWFATDNGKLAINLRYGARMLELAKGKFAIEVASEKDLVPTFEALKSIVASGELDLQMEAASTKLREGFQKVN
jgi:hypothetical protein